MDILIPVELPFGHCCSFLAPHEMPAFEQTCRMTMVMTDKTQTWAGRIASHVDLYHTRGRIYIALQKFRWAAWSDEENEENVLRVNQMANIFIRALRSIRIISGNKGLIKYCLQNADSHHYQRVGESVVASVARVVLRLACGESHVAASFFAQDGDPYVHHSTGSHRRAEERFVRTARHVRRSDVSDEIDRLTVRNEDTDLVQRGAGHRTRYESANRLAAPQLATESQEALSSPALVTDIDDRKAEVLEASAMEADELDNAALMQGLQYGNLDILATGVPWNSEAIVVNRLTRMARCPALDEHFQKTPVLEPCRQRVEDADHSLRPSWGAGALVLVPVTEEQIIEAGLELSYDIVVSLASDVDLIKAALEIFNCKGKKRPTLEISNPHDRRKKFCCALNLQSTGNPSWSSDSLPASASSTPELGTYYHDEENGPVELEAVNLRSSRTNSSFGTPVNPCQ